MVPVLEKRLLYKSDSLYAETVIIELKGPNDSTHIKTFI